ncbi:MAG: class I SAM-dependent methyltransferase [Myxococcales bacterium]|nr:class I SAM-dependent methyltransferase [Myxococcales bacterium]
MKFPTAFTLDQARIVAELERRDREERRAGLRTEQSLKAVAPAVAQLLYTLVVAKGARTIVEFGTSHGYSTLHLAAAAARTGGHVHSVDALAEKTTCARANLEAAGLLDRVALTTSEGAAFAKTLPGGVDFVLVDYPIPAFVPAFPALRERIAPGGLCFVDGGPEGYWDSEGVLEFRTRLEDDPAFVVTILPMHKDQLIAVRVGS